MFILIQGNTSLSKNYVAHSITVVCVWQAEFEKNQVCCALWLSVHMKSVVEQGVFHEFAFDNKVLKTSVEFRICWKHSNFEFKFELRHISTWGACAPSASWLGTCVKIVCSTYTVCDAYLTYIRIQQKLDDASPSKSMHNNGVACYYVCKYYGDCMG